MDRIAGRLMGAMEVTGILQKGVVGREVCPTTEPPHRTSLEIAVIEVNRGDVGIARVQHHRGARGKPRMSLGLRTLLED